MKKLLDDKIEKNLPADSKVRDYAALFRRNGPNIRANKPYFPAVSQWTFQPQRRHNDFRDINRPMRHIRVVGYTEGSVSIMQCIRFPIV